MSGLPSLPPGLPTGLRSYLEKLGRQFEISEAERGSPLQSKPTIQDLIDIGVIKANPNEALTSNGKTFTLANAKNWLAAAVPSWFSSFVNPPAPSGLVVGVNQANYVLVWNAWDSELYGQTLVYRASTNNLSQAILIGSTTGTTYVDNLPPDGVTYYYWIRTEAKSKRLSDFNAVGGTTAGNVVNAPTLSYVFDAQTVVISWPTPTSGLQIKYYIIRYGEAFEGGVAVGTSNTNTLRLPVSFGGTRRFWVAAVDIKDQVGTAAYIDVVVVPPSAPTVALTVQGDSIVLTYSASAGSLPVGSFGIRYGASWEAGTAVAVGAATRFETVVDWVGSRTFWVAAYDTAGNLGSTTQVVFSPTVPSAVTIEAQVVDNNVLLSWSTASGTLPVREYRVDRAGDLVGVISGRFTVLFETLGGNYEYGITGVDSAGNLGTRSSVTVNINEPPDYQLFSLLETDFEGTGITKTTCWVDPATGALLANVDPSETWAQHFSSRGWASVQDQINAGYSLYAVGKTTGSYREEVDYGATVPGSKASMSPTEFFANGTVTMTPKLWAGTNGTDFPQEAPGVWESFFTSFRYVRYDIAFSAAHNGTGLATDTSALVAIKPLQYRLDVKQKTHQGMVMANAGDTGGTSVDITGIFVDVSSIVLTPESTTPLYCVYDFDDVGNPTNFKVLLFTTAGARASSLVSYTIRGV